MSGNLNILPTNKKFGFFFTFVFSILFIYFLYNFSLIFFLTFIFLSFITLFLTLFLPDLLLPFNKLWFKIGLILNKIVSPLILGFIFFIMITPISIITRVFKRDELKLKKTQNLTYWRDNKSSNKSIHDFKNQF